MATAHYLLSCRLYFKQHLMNLMLAARFDCLCMGAPKTTQICLISLVNGVQFEITPKETLFC